MPIHLKILFHDAKKGVLKLHLESALDLVTLYRLMSSGDRIYGRTTREIKKERADETYDSQRVPVSLGISVEKKQVDPLLKELSFLGRIFSSSLPDVVGKFHSIKVQPGDVITVEKRGLTQKHLSLLTQLAERTGSELLCLLIDDDSYLLAQLSEQGVRILDERVLSHGGKAEPEKYSEERRKLVDRACFSIEKAFQLSRGDLCVMGPSMFVDEFLTRLKMDRPDLAEHVARKGYASSATLAGLNEVLRGPLGSDKQLKLKPARDAKLIETLIEHLSQDKRDVCLGREEVEFAAQIKAVKILLIEESYLWKHLDDSSFIKLLEQADRLRAETAIISGRTEAADKLASFGGIAAILRYQVYGVTGKHHLNSANS